jgi:GDPmannose 4,6-dehydratase
MKRALITGITGQDGYYLSKLLFSKGYEVYGFILKTENPLFPLFGEDKSWHDIKQISRDFNEPDSIKLAIKEARPDEIYNLAGVSDIATSIKNPEETMRVNYSAVSELLENAMAFSPQFRFCQASSSEIFSRENPPPQNEEALFGPNNPYGEAKLKAHLEVRKYREEKGAFACAAIFYNHESPKRWERFVTRKITTTLAKIKLGQAKTLELGNLDTVRDWGFAGDYMEAMWLILQAEKPDDYVISTGAGHTVREFVNVAAQALGINLEWSGAGENEVARNERGEIVVKVNPDFYRSIDPLPAIGDSSKAREILGWKPKTEFEELVRMMAMSDIEYVKMQEKP